MPRRPVVLFCLIPLLALFAGPSPGQAPGQPDTQPIPEVAQERPSQSSADAVPTTTTDADHAEPPRDPARIASTHPLHVELRPGSPLHPDGAAHTGRHVLRFSNPGGKPVTIYRPLDGAMWGWYWPHYKFEVTDADGAEVPLPGRCGMSGLWAETTWRESFEVRLMPGEALEMPVYIPQVVHAEPGEYTVRFSYILPPGTTHAHVNGAYTSPLDGKPWLPIPDHAWFGTAEAEPITVTVPER